MSQTDIDRIVELLQSDPRLNEKPWDRYVFFLHVGDRVVSSSGFRFSNRNWYSGSTTCHGSITGIIEELRKEVGLPVDNVWNAAAVTVERNSANGTLHLFYDLDAEAWDMTPENQSDIADRAFRLFGDGKLDRTEPWQQVLVDQTGLRARTAKLLTHEPTDDAGWPADLPAGATEVVVLDDEPNPTLTLRVFVPGTPKYAFVRFDQLAVHAE